MSGWAAAGSIGGDLIGGYLQAKWANDRQQNAFDENEKMFARRYQTTVQDMMSAGLNPMLAYSQGGGSPPGAPVTSSGESSMGSRAVVSYNQSKVATAQEANINMDTQKKEAEKTNIDQDTLVKTGMIPLLAAQVVQASNSAAQSDALRKKIEAEIPNVQQELDNLRARAAKDRSDISLNDSIEKVNITLNSLRSAQLYLTRAETRTESLSGDILDPKAKAAKSWSGEAAAKGRNISDILSPVSDFVSPFKFGTGGGYRHRGPNDY